MNNESSKNHITVIWQRIYKDWFGLEKSFSKINLPDEYDPNEHFAVIVAKETKPELVTSGMEKKFKVKFRAMFFFEEFGATDHDRRAVKDDYVVLFKKNVEADEEFKNLSAKYLWKTKHQGITLMERLLMEALYFEDTKTHLDNINRTLCCGSKDIDRSVPCVYWDSEHDELVIDWEYKSQAGENYRSRKLIA